MPLLVQVSVKTSLSIASHTFLPVCTVYTSPHKGGPQWSHPHKGQFEIPTETCYRYFL